MKRECGQAFILVLILLTVGALVIVPTLRLTGDTLKSSQVYVQFSNEDYAADAATEYGLWRLNWEPGYASSLPVGVESEPFSITLNGVTAWTTITPQATPGDELGGQDLMKDKISYQVVKGVSPQTANVSEPKEFTYTVNIRCYDPYASLPDNYLEEIIDNLSRGFLEAGDGYVAGSTSWDEEEWGIAPFEPDTNWKDKDAEQFWELKWKFKDRPPFTDGVEFDYGETKSMSFRVVSTDGLDEGVYGNDIEVKPSEKNLGAFQAPIIVGDPEYIEVPRGFLDIKKTVDKEIIYPNEPTTVTYTVTLTNVDVVPVLIKELTDWLPSSGIDDKDSPGVFRYVDNSTTANITHVDLTTTEVPLPDTYPDAKNILEEKWKGGLDELRWELKWKLENHEDARFDPIMLQPGEVVAMMFSANATLEASGIYFDEFLVKVIRYPLDVDLSEPQVPPGGFWPPGRTQVHVTVTMENVDVWDVTVKKIKARLPSDDTGEEDTSFQYVPDSTIVTIADGGPVAYNDNDDFFKDNVVKSEWEGKKDRWKVEWDPKDDIILQPGEVLTWEFDTTVNPQKSHLAYNELLWEVDLGKADDKRNLYSFPTAGTLVPMYDLEVETLSSILATNAWLGGGHKISPHSKHWDKHR